VAQRDAAVDLPKSEVSIEHDRRRDVLHGKAQLEPAEFHVDPLPALAPRAISSYRITVRQRLRLRGARRLDTARNPS
jgi:hypothetical protein